MELIRAYSDKVAGYLPKSIRQDTADELYDSLCEQYEESQDEQPDEAQFLQSRPHPIKMATQFSEKESLYLIGPAYYLSFIEAIKIAAIIVGAIHVGLFALAAWGSGTVMQAFLQTLANLPGAYLYVLVVIGIVFVVLEKAGERAKWLDKWSVKDLQRELGKEKISRFETLFELNVSAIAFMWLLGVIQLPSVVRHDGVWLTNLTAQIPSLLLTLMVIVLAVDILVSVYKLIRGVWSRSQRLAAIALDGLWIVFLLVLINIDPLVTQEALAGVPQATDVLQVINNAIDVSLGIAVLIIGWDAVSHLLRLLKNAKHTVQAVS